MALASLTVQSLGETFIFETAKTLGGYIPTEPINIIEDIISSGVDFARWLLDHREFRKFALRTLEAVSSYDEAINRGNLYDKAIGQLATLTITIRDVDYTFRNVYIRPHEQPTALTGSVMGVTIDSDRPNGVVCIWQLELTEISTGSTVISSL